MKIGLVQLSFLLKKVIIIIITCIIIIINSMYTSNMHISEQGVFLTCNSNLKT